MKEKLLAENFRGCIAVQKDGKTVFSYENGYADLANELPNRLDTRFATASAGKVFVAVGILQLIQEGKLSFNDTIGDLFSMDWEQIDPEITIFQLLTHTSGIPDYFDESVMEDYDELWRDYPNYKIRRSSDLLPLFLHKPMMYPKGERFQYNNTGFVVLGMVIEQVTGLLFDQYLQRHVFALCGMERTGYYELDRLPRGCANSYIWDRQREEYYTNIYSVDVKGTGAGGAFTTVLDIQRFWDGLLDGKLLTPEMVQQMLSPHAFEDGKPCYGYGIWLSEDQKGGYLSYFEGCDPGVSFISRDFGNGQIVAVSNYGDDVWKAARELQKAFFPER